MIGPLLGGAIALVKLVSDKIADEFGLDKKVTYEVAIKVAREWVDRERAAVTDARKRAVKRVGK